MPDDLDAILRRVASGELTPEQAEPFVAAAMASSDTPPPPPSPTTSPPPPPPPPRDAPSTSAGSGRGVRIQVMEQGRVSVNLRVPMSWTSLAAMVPGLTGTQADQVRQALRDGRIGRILEIQDEDGDGVIITTE